MKRPPPSAPATQRDAGAVRPGHRLGQPRRQPGAGRILLLWAGVGEPRVGRPRVPFPFRIVPAQRRGPKSAEGPRWSGERYVGEGRYITQRE
ncbi:hypothetical protein E0L36_08095 [Streptomyces sp. AJS327]|nr:hypothetical protein [Streptomyces sp. AJS327]